jgi:hypothetical protein
MQLAKSLASLLAVAGAILAPAAAEAQSVRGSATIVPAAPLPFETVSLRIPVDSCAFLADRLVVTKVGNAIQVQIDENSACSPPGPVRNVDVNLGAYPPGSYDVEAVGLYNMLSGRVAQVLQRLSFTVPPRATVLPSFRFPLADYNGLWWNPQESGWGLSIHQSARDTLFATLFVYDAQNRAQWFTIQPGGWTSSTRWEGPLYRTTGPYFAGPFDPGQVLVQAAGQGVLEFDTAPGEATTARFTYTVDGVTTVKTITRMGL